MQRRQFITLLGTGLAAWPFGATVQLALLVLCGGAVANAAEIKVLSGSAVTTAMAELISAFEQSSGHKLLSDFDATIGAMTQRVLSGEECDVAIVSRSQIELLMRAGKLVAGSRVDIAKVGVGVFVRKGAFQPDISSAETFKRSMLAAKSIGYSDPAAGAPVSIYLIEMFERLGIAEEMKAKTTVFKQRGERFDAVARGDVEIGFNQISAIVARSDVDLVGPLPVPLQHRTLFASGIAAASKEPEAAQAFVRFITAPEAQAVWKAKGFEAP